ncbi:MAG: anaerobic carbon-monoxide dehydrogenase catalytic subunit [Candidatus Methanoplasma sp.]|jgi:carbon-monoxide dehydrogenase catalytic subunit|nr:anaerobic carbon-monoxide dehydrogenase catalytic subunit [Candidatus Methanoplasma sp.]
MAKWSKQKICASADEDLENFIITLPTNTAFHRVDTQKLKCGFGLGGICCRLCANGPCRVTEDSPKGVCGATADTMVARNFLRTIAAGSGCYIHIVEKAALNLKAIALAKGELRGIEALDRLCAKFDIEGTDVHDKALKVADAVLNDLYKPDYEKMELTKKMAYPPRYKRWEELGILPGGAKSEVFSAVVKTSTNLNSDPVHMLLNCLRLGISTGVYGLTLTNLLNDVVIGEPELRLAPVGFRVIDPDYRNIMITGHQHSRFSYIQDRLIQPDIVKKAQAAGAKGFKIVGCTCVGQDMQLRGVHCTQIFDGHAGNNFTSEAILSTGGIDAVISEFNCTLPGIEPICDEYKIKQICVDSIAKKKNAILKEFTYETRVKVVDEIIDEVVSAYRERRKTVPMSLLPEHGNSNSLTGVSEVSLKKFLGDSWKPLIGLIAEGKIKGVAGVVGCSNLQGEGHDKLTVALVKELIAKDIIVLTAGCSSGGIENCGLMRPEAADLAGPNLKAVCKQLGIPPVLNFGPCLAIGRLEIVATELAEELGVDLPQLPLVLSAAQWLEEQALADGCFGLALGLPLHLGIPPFVTGSELAVKIFTEDMKSLTGGYLVINDDAVDSANILEDIILQKRKDLGLP